MARRDEQKQSSKAEPIPVAEATQDSPISNDGMGLYIVVGPGSIGAEGRFFAPGEMIMLTDADARRHDIQAMIKPAE